MDDLTSFLSALHAGRSLSESEMADAMRLIMDGHIDSAQIADFLTILSQNGETVDEITGAARVLREKATAIQSPPMAVDCCGTGGDGASTYNISTAVALVAAACGVPVAKHGNRAASSKSGAADVLEALGVPLSDDREKLQSALQEIGFCFLMAPHHHSALKHVVPVRKQLGFRTIFNLLGPLANPAGTDYQLIGVYAPEWLEPMAECLNRLGTKRAWLVHGHDGLDEITLTDATDVVTLDHGQIERFTVAPEDFGMTRCESDDLTGGDAQENAAALRGLLDRKNSAYRDIVCANTAAVLRLHQPELCLKDGAKKAGEAIDSGSASAILRRYTEFLR